MWPTKGANSDMLIFLLGLLVGGPIGWFSSQFLGEPWKQFQKLRRRARATMDFTANISKREIDPEKYGSAVEEVRRVATDLGALHETISPPTRWVFRKLGYDLLQAKGALLGFSNSLSDKSGAKAEFRHKAEMALKLTLSYPNRLVRRDR